MDSGIILPKSRTILCISTQCTSISTNGFKASLGHSYRNFYQASSYFIKYAYLEKSSPHDHIA